MKKQIVIILSSCCLLACASTEEGQVDAAFAAESPSVDCISQGSIRDYTVLDNANLIVGKSANRKYHVQLTRQARGLRSSSTIGVYSPTGRICSRFGEIIVDEGFGTERNLIASVRRLTPESEEELLIRFGKIEPKYKHTRQPVEVQGAEVEELD